MFSIEVTTTYFAVRNYFRGFFGAVCGATFFRLLVMWFQGSNNITVLFATHFNDFPYNPQELLAFAALGWDLKFFFNLKSNFIYFSVICGIGGAFYVWAHRQYVYFTRNNKIIKNMVKKNRFLYPGIVAFIVRQRIHITIGDDIIGVRSKKNDISGGINHISKWFRQVYCRWFEYSRPDQASI